MYKQLLIQKEAIVSLQLISHIPFCILALTDRKLDVLEKKTRAYDAVISNIRSLDEIQAILNKTRNIVQYYHPLGLNFTFAGKLTVI